MFKFKIVLSILLFCIVSCKNSTQKMYSVKKESKTTIEEKSSNSCDYKLKNDTLNICITFNKGNRDTLRFDMEFKYNLESINITGNAGLITLEDDDGNLYIPEGTTVFDNLNDEDFICDSTYSFNSQDINLSFGFEEQTSKRLFLMIYKSKINLIKDNEYTLYKE